MNWSILLIVLILSASIGTMVHRVLIRRRPGWSRRRRTLTTAFALPGAILLAAFAGIGWELVRGPGTGENMQDLAIAAIAFLGALFGLIALAGGFIGAALDRRRLEP